MGKLNIAHHKSYHPYRRDNIEKVRRDEEEARLKEAQEEGRMTLADSEARITLLRERAGVSSSNSKSRRREDEKRERELLAQATDSSARREALAPPASSSLTSLGSGKHINLFEDLEHNMVASALATSKALQKLGKEKTKEAAELEKGIPLAPSAKDLKPWYSEKKKVDDGPVDDLERTRDLSHKSRSDPLRAIERELATRFPSSQSSPGMSSAYGRTWGEPPSYPRRTSDAPQISANGDPARAARETRESSERARAEALKARRRRELAGSATPSTIRGGDDAFKYGDQFHSREVAEAHRRREYADARERTWGGERPRRGTGDEWRQDRRREDRSRFR
ncbi:uncharacterized protein FOMMEDRAFT_165430 [Fomitiporia mediterranea MF3/22]|uniref:uncharacterized protein n=1 Tax=Fomitiporia mediterranea (strain MF3/22) TaxID=694068 RepID=UPI000440768E|nr:uncharacterized protein FOMMEDRAFT_165430 [Fomitiporia mediterranea MF3/22]EJD06710.1 hypothetical protein FOMMEDRAFT_165430 [Fomitiporia mediterranea MF3/22]